MACQHRETQVPFDYAQGRLSTPFASVAQDESVFEWNCQLVTPEETER